MNVTVAREQNIPGASRRTPVWMRVLLLLFLVVFFVGGIYAGYVLYATLRAIVGHMDLASIPFASLSSLGASSVLASGEGDLPLPQMGTLAPGSTSNRQAVGLPVAQLLPGQRINILLLGIDRRKGIGWGHLTDTIIIVTVDPANRTAGMLSIPRDLYIPIPGNGEDRINTANVRGETQGYPGGGPALLKRTIEVNFGISVDYYIMLDFEGFQKTIDLLGGVDIEVTKALYDTQYPDPLPEDPYHYKTVDFEPGLQHMDGARALEYARSRMSTTDFDRAKRQQALLIAVRDKALNVGLLGKLPSLMGTMKDTFKTDLTVGEIMDLARLVPDIDMANLNQLVLEKPYVYGYKTESGAAVQLPKWDLIRPAVEELFTTPMVAVAATPLPVAPTPVPTISPAQIEELQALARDGARIAVQNGTSQANYAARVAAMLIEEGYQVVEFGDADRIDYANTVIVDYSGKTYTLDRLVAEFGVLPENLRRNSNPRSPIDIRVVVGQDFSQTLP